jgi:hypothetical protein
MNTNNPDIYICQCGSFEHQLILWYDEDNDQIYSYVRLITHRGFFKRLWYGLKYAFGHKSKYGNFDEFVFDVDDLDRLQSFLNKRKASTQKIV